MNGILTVGTLSHETFSVFAHYLLDNVNYSFPEYITISVDITVALLNPTPRYPILLPLRLFDAPDLHIDIISFSSKGLPS